MDLLLPWHQYLLAILCVLSGMGHFSKHANGLLALFPENLPMRNTLFTLSGIGQMVFGIMLLLPAWQSFGAWGIIALAVAFLPVLFQLLSSKNDSPNLPQQTVVFLIAVQLLVIWWAFAYT